MICVAEVTRSKMINLVGVEDFGMYGGRRCACRVV
jgi:hypothetical protein